MTPIDNFQIDSALRIAGFIQCKDIPRLFLLAGDAVVSPAYYCAPVRKRRAVHLGGGVGLYFKEFEKTWNSELGKEGLRSGFTLPMIMIIDNYISLIDEDLFTFTNDYDEITRCCIVMREFCLQFPSSIEEFSQILVDKKIIDKNFSDYLHIFPYNDNDNLYYRKSVRFIQWFCKMHPELSPRLLDCLTEYQIRRVENFEL